VVGGSPSLRSFPLLCVADTGSRGVRVVAAGGGLPLCLSMGAECPSLLRRRGGRGAHARNGEEGTDALCARGQWQCLVWRRGTAHLWMSGGFVAPHETHRAATCVDVDVFGVAEEGGSPRCLIGMWTGRVGAADGD